MTLVNDASFFIDYFLVIPAGATSTSTSVTSSNLNPSSQALTASSTVSGADSSTTPSAITQSTSRVPIGPIVGGTLGGLALLIIAILAFLLCRKRRKPKDKNLRESKLLFF